MHGRAVYFCAGIERASMRVEALEIGQQGRMDIDQAALPLTDKAGGEQAHESRQTNQINAIFLEHRLQSAFEAGAILAERGVINDLRADTGSVRDQQTTRIRPIRQNQANL